MRSWWTDVRTVPFRSVTDGTPHVEFQGEYEEAQGLSGIVGKNRWSLDPELLRWIRERPSQLLGGAHGSGGARVVYKGGFMVFAPETEHEIPECDMCDEETYYPPCLKCGLRICNTCYYEGSRCNCEEDKRGPRWEPPVFPRPFGDMRDSGYYHISAHKIATISRLKERVRKRMIQP